MNRKDRIVTQAVSIFRIMCVTGKGLCIPIEAAESATGSTYPEHTRLVFKNGMNSSRHPGYLGLRDRAGNG